MSRPTFTLAFEHGDRTMDAAWCLLNWRQDGSCLVMNTGCAPGGRQVPIEVIEMVRLSRIMPNYEEYRTPNGFTASWDSVEIDAMRRRLAAEGAARIAEMERRTAHLFAEYEAGCTADGVNARIEAASAASVMFGRLLPGFQAAGVLLGPEERP